MREDDPAAKYTPEVLVTKTTEGRIRVCSLCRLIYGVNSLEYLKSRVDLANTYALQGMWPQVKQHLTICEKLLSRRDANQNRSNFEMLGKVDLAFKSRSIHQIMRKHAFENKGVINLSMFLFEIEQTLRDHDNKSKDHSIDIVNLNEITSLSMHPCQWENFNKNSDVNSIKETYELLSSLQFHFNLSGSTTWTYLQLLSFMREDCEIVIQWRRDIESFILPQSRAAIEMVFQLAGGYKRGIVHLADLAKSLKTCTSVTRTSSWGTFLQSLLSTASNLTSPSDAGEYESISEYKIINSLTLEEALFTYMIESSIIDPMDHMRLQVQNLSGVLNMFTGNLPGAESYLRAALRDLGALNLESELIACE